VGQEKIPEEEEYESEEEHRTLNDSGGSQIKSKLSDLDQGLYCTIIAFFGGEHPALSP